MRRWLLLGLILLVGGGVFAQDDANTPVGAIGRLEAGDFRALAVTAKGDRLLVADAETDQVRVYDFGDPASPALLNTLDLNGEPVLLAGGDGFGVVAMKSDGSTDTLEFVAPAFPGARTQYRSGWSIFDIPKNPRVLVLSPDSHWGIVLTDSGYNLLEISDPGNVSNLPIEGSISDVALTNTTAYVLHGDTLVTSPLQSGEALQEEESVELGGTPSHIVLNADASLGVIVIDNTRLVFFNPVTLEMGTEIPLSGGAVSGIAFLEHADGELLLVTQEGESAIRVFSAADEREITDLSSAAGLANPIRTFVTHGQYMVVTDGTTISIFSS